MPTVLPDFSIAGSSAIITGASRGIGRAMALTFAEAGVELCLAARSKDALDQVAEEVRATGRRCVAVPTDVTRGDDVAHMAERAIAELGRVDILVNNAGVMVVKPMAPLPGFSPPGAAALPGFFEPTSSAEWDRVMGTNLTGALLCMRALGPHLLQRGKGKVISVSSVAAARAGRFRFTYDVSKSALSQLTRSMAVEWARYRVNVNAIAPGYVRTGLNEAAMRDQRQRQRFLSEVPLRRFATEREVALLAVYLASPAADHITGQTVFLDGGALA